MLRRPWHNLFSQKAMKEVKEAMTTKMQSWWDGFVQMIPDLLLVLVILFIATWLGKYVKRFTYRLLFRISHKASPSNLTAGILQVLTVLAGFMLSLDILQLNHTVSSMLAGAGIIGIIVGFALQDITANFISGLYITFKRPFDIGHTVKTNDFIGNIEQIQLRTTTIRTFSGLHLMIPNRDIIQKPLINYSLTKERRIELEFFVDSAADLSAVHGALTSAMAKLSYLYPGKAVEIYFNDFRDNAVKLAVWYWIDNHGAPGYMVARHDAIFHILESLKAIQVSLLVPVSLQNLKPDA